VQIPSSFFKVIVWKSTTGPKSVGLVVDQRNLLSEPRRNLRQPQGVAAVDVAHWRLSIASIEQRTGLDFGATIRNADTIGEERQPQVGEAQILVKSLADLLPKQYRV
jgi:endonuclease G, mitochondrial